MKNIAILLVCFCFALTACKKGFLDIDPPVKSIVTEQVFADSINAHSALQGAYLLMNTSGLDFSNGKLSIYLGMYADELTPFYIDEFDYAAKYYYNNFAESDPDILSIWSSPYRCIYQLNAIEESVQKTETIAPTAKVRFVAEAKFLRAFIYFYLVNLYGDVPYVTSTSWDETRKTPRSDQNTVYENVVKDLLYAQNALDVENTFGTLQRARATKSAATALLARCYLYREDWNKAEIEATKVIANNLFTLSTSLNGVFESNSSETILQWSRDLNFDPYHSTNEGVNLNPVGTQPQYYLSTWVLNDFEAGDQRREAWIRKTTYLGTDYYCAYKYKLGQAQKRNGTVTEYYKVLRLAEQYLIRAEARAKLNKLTAAIDDVNMIRKRAGLTTLPYSLTQSQILTAIAHERRIEFFAEWGHRWFDLKRTGKADEVMAVVSPLKNGGIAWQPYKKLLPIPQPEIMRSPFLTQNPGYNN